MEEDASQSRQTEMYCVCWEHLVKSLVRRSFNSHLRKSLDNVPGKMGDIESVWAMFHASIVETNAVFLNVLKEDVEEGTNVETRRKNVLKAVHGVCMIPLCVLCVFIKPSWPLTLFASRG